MDPLQSWREEQNSAYLYRVLAQLESGARGRLFVNLAEAALDQAHTWAELARQQGLPLPAHYRPPLRTRLVAQLLRRVGPRRMLQVLAAMKVRGLSVYTRPPAHPHPVSAEEPEKRHAALTSGGNLRAAVFGVNDGLLSNASLILGMAGAAVDNRVILLTGLAGAFSMAAGEYVSMRSQREMFEFQIRLEREELRPTRRKRRKSWLSSIRRAACRRRMPSVWHRRWWPTRNMPWTASRARNWALIPMGWVPPGVRPDPRFWLLRPAPCSLSCHSCSGRTRTPWPRRSH